MRKLIEYFSETKMFIFLIGLSLLTGATAYIYVLRLPKPETFSELVKYYFNSPGEYLTGVLLMLLASFLFALVTIVGINLMIAHFNELTRLGIAICFTLLFLSTFLTLYFVTYFSMVIGTLLIVGAIGLLIVYGLSRR